MSKTAYSTHFARELDPAQLAALMRGSQIVGAFEETLTAAERELISQDVVCASCGVAGAQIVRAARSRRSNAVVRQAHFRFVSPTSGNAHHPCCEFHGADDGEHQSDNLIDFASTRSAETRIIRTLVCKGIEQGLFDQSSIRAMRQWFFDLKTANRRLIDIDASAIQWTADLVRHPSYLRWVFQPAHAHMPGFDWKRATWSEFTERYWRLFEHVDHTKARWDARERARALAKRHHGREVIDPAALRETYELTVQLASFVGLNSGLDFRRSKPDSYRWGSAPAALLALCALVLYVCDWNLNEAVLCFATILRAPEPTSDLLGNTLGLNPYHDYAAWNFVIHAQDLARLPTGVRIYKDELAKIEADLRQSYDAWLSQPQ